MKNLAAENPEVVRRLKKMHKEYVADMTKK